NASISATAKPTPSLMNCPIVRLYCPWAQHHRCAPARRSRSALPHPCGLGLPGGHHERQIAADEHELNTGSDKLGHQRIVIKSAHARPLLMGAAGIDGPLI